MFYLTDNERRALRTIEFDYSQKNLVSIRHWIRYDDFLIDVFFRYLNITTCELVERHHTIFCENFHSIKVITVRMTRLERELDAKKENLYEQKINENSK